MRTHHQGRPRRAAALVVVAVVTVAAAALGALAPSMAAVGPASSTPVTTHPNGRSGELSMLTYNVAGLPEGLSGSNPSVNTPQISPRLNAYDLVVVQEDWVDPDPPVPPFDFFHDDLVSQVDHPYLSTPLPPPLGTTPDRPEALIADGLNRLSRFPFGPVTRVRWTNCFGGIDQSDGGAADCLSLKGFSVATTELAPGVEVDVYNLHAEAGNTPLDRQYSAEDFVQLADFILAHSAGRPILIGGDFNLHTDEVEDGAVYDQFLAATGITDACQVVDCGTDADDIDKIGFRDGGGVAFEVLDHNFEIDEFRRGDGEPLSDHDALRVDIRWHAGPAPTTTSTSSTSTTAPPTSTTFPARATTASPRFTG